jgi:hypothetical protein
VEDIQVNFNDGDMQGAWAIRQERADAAVEVAQHTCDDFTLVTR